MNIFARLLFSHMSSLVKLSKKKHIEESDLPALPEHLHPEHGKVAVEKINWSSSKVFLFSLIRVLTPFTRNAYAWFFFSALMSLASPVLVNRFVGLISAGITSQNISWALTYGSLLGVCGFLAGLSLQHYFYNTLQSYQIITNILNEKIFRHSLRLTQAARQKNQIGDIVNHMSSDSESIADFPVVVGDICYSMFMATAVVAMLFYYIGVSAIAALAVLFTLAPLTSFVAKRFTALDEEMMKHRDHRVTMMTQVLNAIRVVKYFAWERSVSKEVLAVRGEELRSRKKLARAEVISSLGYLAVSTVVLFVALAVHAWRGEVLDAALIFTCISLFGLLEGPFGDMSRLISRYTAAKVGADRILKFLKEESQEIRPVDGTRAEKSVAVNLVDISVTYPGSHQEALKNIEVKVPAGSSLAIVGPVGAGKSTLLYALLGEAPLAQGKVQYGDVPLANLPRLAYVPQEAYIVNDSLLENMTFGEKLTSEDVRRAVHASCLTRDLKEWAGGLRTEIGEKGVNLSGGQKQRVSLARAYLRHPQVVLLDDPLSAVDTETENLLCERLIFGAWKDVTRIVVTHRLEHLGSFDQILYLEDGRAHGVGTLTELLKICEPFAKFYGEHKKVQGEGEAEQLPAEAAQDVATVEIEEKKTRVTEDEDREVGAVKSRVYWDYISSLGGDSKLKPLILILLFGGSLAMIGLPLLQKAWLSYYTAHVAEWTALQAIGIYGLIGILVLVGSMLNHLFWLERGIAAGKSMHDKMLKSVLGAPVRFFDSTPVGRILQRFSRDIESVDVHLQWSFDSAVHCGMQVIVAIALILGLMPLMIFVIAPVMTLYYILQRDYRRPAREVKRFDSVGRSPRYAHFKESLQGLAVIRGFDKTSWFMRQFYDKLAHSQRMFYAHYMVNRWFSARIPLIGGVISLTTAVAVTISAYYGVMNAGVAGLVTLYSLSFWGYLNWGVRVFADIESRMTSIERLKFFAQLPSEVSVLKPAETPVRETWPEKGGIEVRGLKVRYASHLPLVLKGLSFAVEPGTRVGIIGRTGSGKSTFFQSLFRFIEAEEGSIVIDGVDIASVHLERLRRNLAIIPQDPTLFLGTIRNNLDRYEEYSDEQVQEALQQASMWNYVNSLPRGLQSPVTEGGLNLSQGQRQLLCLARALLTKAKVIVMDEATASVDVQTDALLQAVIRKSFAGVTMLIIAHRLGTIADCDKVVEISAGEIKSIRTPDEFSTEELEESLT
ncbi:multidrug ABC transporter ATP-binding protein [Bdellovibrio bacteriovorus]|uniref:Multidrug ABC transporter ATP-binding protein n=1 Tax=Bdellovibrio bacteriovorus TaxID=959 RepID=A0A150WLZ2_BDEBC|nr:ABC transporter transmembrane domain-containing protein [Bdellovibrio bacteriovorus]KYG65513.1 multidrug ABC transporter ATP-binding protein [Bdellovibrio bacteriovorus]